MRTAAEAIAAYRAYLDAPLVNGATYAEFLRLRAAEADDPANTSPLPALDVQRDRMHRRYLAAWARDNGFQAPDWLTASSV